jgi:protein-L-isoaspartate O-methyltransferase
MFSCLKASNIALIRNFSGLSSTSGQIRTVNRKQGCASKSLFHRIPSPYARFSIRRFSTQIAEDQEPNWLNDDEGEEDHPLSHKQAVELMDKNELIKNDTAYQIFLETDPSKFATSTLAEELKAEGLKEAETEEEKRIENELYMDNWLHSAMTVVGIISVLDEDLGPGSKVLDLGCGNGYMSVVLAKMVSPDGTVIAVDFDASKLKFAKSVVIKHFPELEPVIQWKEQDIFSDLKSFGPFDAINVGGGLSDIPQSLLEMVRPGGCLIGATPEIEPESGENHYMLRKYLVRPEGGVLPINLMYVNFEPLQEPSL